jgi:hypothetical protein
MNTFWADVRCTVNSGQNDGLKNGTFLSHYYATAISNKLLTLDFSAGWSLILDSA